MNALVTINYTTIFLKNVDLDTLNKWADLKTVKRDYTNENWVFENTRVKIELTKDEPFEG